MLKFLQMAPETTTLTTLNQQTQEITTPLEISESRVVPVMQLEDEFRLTQTPVQVEQWQNILSELEFNRHNQEYELQLNENRFLAIQKDQDESNMKELLQILKNEVEQSQSKREEQRQIMDELEKMMWNSKSQLMYFKKFVFDQQSELNRYNTKHNLISEQTNEMLALKNNLEFEIFRGSSLIEREEKFLSLNLDRLQDKSNYIKTQITKDIKVFQKIRNQSHIQKQVLQEQKVEILSLDEQKERIISQRGCSDDIIDEIGCLKQLIGMILKLEGEEQEQMSINDKSTFVRDNPGTNRKGILKTVMMIKSEFYRRVKQVQQSEPSTPQILTTTDKERQIEQFYSFCNKQLEKYVSAIINFFHTQKLRAYNLSEQFDNFNKQKHIMDHIVLILEKEEFDLKQCMDKNQFLEKHSIVPQNEVEKELIRPQSQIDNIDRVYKKYMVKIDKINATIFRQFCNLNQNLKRWTMMMLQVNQIQESMQNNVFTIDLVDPQNSFQSGFKIFYDQATRHTIWIKKDDQDTNLSEQVTIFLNEYFIRLNLNQHRNHKLIDLNQALIRKFIKFLKRDYFFYNFITIKEVSDQLNRYAAQTKIVLAYTDDMDLEQLNYIYYELLSFLIEFLSELKQETNIKMITTFKSTLKSVQELLLKIQYHIGIRSQKVRLLTLVHIPSFNNLLEPEEQFKYHKQRKNSDFSPFTATEASDRKNQRQDSIRFTLIPRLSLTQRGFMGVNRMFKQVKQAKNQNIVDQKCKQYEQYYNHFKNHEQKLKLVPVLPTITKKTIDTNQDDYLDKQELEHIDSQYEMMRRGTQPLVVIQASLNTNKNYMSNSLRNEKIEVKMREFAIMQKNLENTFKQPNSPQTPVVNGMARRMNIFNKRFGTKLEKKSTENLLLKIRETYTTLNTNKSKHKMKSEGTGYGFNPHQRSYSVQNQDKFEAPHKQVNFDLEVEKPPTKRLTTLEQVRIPPSEVNRLIVRMRNSNSQPTTRDPSVIILQS